MQFWNANALVTEGEETALVDTTNLLSNSSWVCLDLRGKTHSERRWSQKGARRGYQDAPLKRPPYLTHYLE
jgi:hypothetical protein